MIDRFKKLPKFARIAIITAVMFTALSGITTLVFFILNHSSLMTLFGLSTLFITCMLSTIVDEEMFEDDDE